MCAIPGQLLAPLDAPLLFYNKNAKLPSFFSVPIQGEARGPGLPAVLISIWPL